MARHHRADGRLFMRFIAEIFRAGIQAVDRGQIEAAKALGFSRYAALPTDRVSAGDPHDPAAAIRTILSPW
jgi:hypothetical protein